MKRIPQVLIWGNGTDYQKYIHKIKKLELNQDISVIGITSNAEIKGLFSDYPFVSKGEIACIEFDYIIVASIFRFEEILNEAISMGINSEKIISLSVFLVPDFDFNKYLSIKERKLSIISNNCWGGFTYNQLGLQFLSPFVNMFLLEHEYIKMLYDLKNYLNYDIKFSRLEYEQNLKHYYPVGVMKDISLFFNHYNDFDYAKNKWNSRLQRINWDNLFIMMYTTSKELLSEFDGLPFQNKVCFVPFESEYKSALVLDPNKYDNLKSCPFWEVVIEAARNRYYYYDVFDLLNRELEPSV